MTLTNKVKCSLCDMEFFKSDPDLDLRKTRHANFHKPTKIKRNTTLGTVKWIDVARQS